MSRASTTNEYVLRVNLKSGSAVRRFCQVRVDHEDNVYVFQPRKGGSVKISYHESGQKHLKIGSSPAMFVMQLDGPEWIRTEEPVWSKSFENFADLLPYDREPADAVFEIELPPVSADTIALAQVSIGRFFDPTGWTMGGVQQATLQQKVFKVPASPSQLCLCVRVLRLSQACEQPPNEGMHPAAQKAGGRVMPRSLG